MRSPIASLLITLSFITCSCREENPYFDSSNWNMNQSVEQLADILRTENQILFEAQSSSSLPESAKRDLWVLLMDETDIGFEVWVRLKRNSRLVSPFCDVFSKEIVPLLNERSQMHDGGSSIESTLLSDMPPSSSAGQGFQDRFNAYGARALYERCGDPTGYQKRIWP